MLEKLKARKADLEKAMKVTVDTFNQKQKQLNALKGEIQTLYMKSQELKAALDEINLLLKDVEEK
jgi:chaperonin cofactor prefoldin